MPEYPWPAGADRGGRPGRVGRRTPVLLAATAALPAASGYTQAWLYGAALAAVGQTPQSWSPAGS